MSALKRGQTGSHYFVDEQEVAGDHGARVDHLSLDVVVVVDSEVRRVDHLAGRRVHADGTTGIFRLAQKFDQDLLRVKS